LKGNRGREPRESKTFNHIRTAREENKKGKVSTKEFAFQLGWLRETNACRPERNLARRRNILAEEKGASYCKKDVLLTECKVKPTN